MKFEPAVSTNVPIPQSGRMSGVADFLRKLHVGDSFLCDEKRRSAMHTTAALAKIKVATRAEGKGQIRVWRTA